jgi:primosomal protein N'
MNNQKRYQCLIKAEKWSPIREFAFKIMEKYSNISKKLKVILDLDPYQML